MGQVAPQAVEEGSRMTSPNLKNNSVRRRRAKELAKAERRRKNPPKRLKAGEISDDDRLILGLLDYETPEDGGDSTITTNREGIFVEIQNGLTAEEIRGLFNLPRLHGKSLWFIRRRLGSMNRRGLVSFEKFGAKGQRKTIRFTITDAGRKALQGVREKAA